MTVLHRYRVTAYKAFCNEVFKPYRDEKLYQAISIQGTYVRVMFDDVLAHYNKLRVFHSEILRHPWLQTFRSKLATMFVFRAENSEDTTSDIGRWKRNFDYEDDEEEQEGYESMSD